MTIIFKQTEGSKIKAQILFSQKEIPCIYKMEHDSYDIILIDISSTFGGISGEIIDSKELSFDIAQLAGPLCGYDSNIAYLGDARVTFSEISPGMYHLIHMSIFTLLDGWSEVFSL